MFEEDIEITWFKAEKMWEASAIQVPIAVMESDFVQSIGAKKKKQYRDASVEEMEDKKFLLAVGIPGIFWWKMIKGIKCIKSKNATSSVFKAFTIDDLP